MKNITSGRRILDEVSDRIIAITSGRVILAALIGFLILGYLVNSRPFGIAQLKEMTGGVGILDMEILYTPEQAYAQLAALGEVGRAFYLTHIIPLDLLLPVFLRNGVLAYHHLAPAPLASSRKPMAPAQCGPTHWRFL